MREEPDPMISDTAGGGDPERWRSLRPKERVIRRLADNGMDETDIAWRFRSSPGHIQRMLRLTELPRTGHAEETLGEAKLPHRPIERAVLKARSRGASHAEIAARLRRSPGYVEQVERLATLRTQRGDAS